MEIINFTINRIIICEMYYTAFSSSLFYVLLSSCQGRIQLLLPTKVFENFFIYKDNVQYGQYSLQDNCMLIYALHTHKLIFKSVQSILNILKYLEF